MNLTAKYYAAPNIASRSRAHITVTPRQYAITFVLVIAVLMSALGVVYVKDLNRNLLMQHQKIRREYNKAYVDHGKLLLEQSTWATQKRVQNIASQRLGMVTPTSKRVVIVKL